MTLSDFKHNTHYYLTIPAKGALPGVPVVLSSIVVFPRITHIFLGIHFDIFVMSPLLIILPSLHISQPQIKEDVYYMLGRIYLNLDLIDSPKQNKKC